jgi:hypothetical protein
MTKNRIYTEAVRKGEKTNEVIVPLDDVFEDARGKIQNLLFTNIASVARITSKKGSIRANHYHITDWHYSYVESGSVMYFEREIGETRIPEPKLCEPGTMFFTRSMVEHAMLFLCDSTIFTFAKNIRAHAEHEADVKRVEFITSKIAEHYLCKQ